MIRMLGEPSLLVLFSRRKSIKRLRQEREKMHENLRNCNGILWVSLVVLVACGGDESADWNTGGAADVDAGDISDSAIHSSRVLH